jgi:hypothetical protein
LIAAGLLGLLAGLGVDIAPAAEMLAQRAGSCRSNCWESYGACYKSTSNRQRCQAQLQRCLDGCIRSKR